jgi:hypothetical protein
MKKKNSDSIFWDLREQHTEKSDQILKKNVGTWWVNDKTGL